MLTLGAPVLAHGLGQSIGTFAIGVAIIRLASLASIPVLRLADRWGRRTLLFVSLALFTIATGATSLATGLVVFVVVQMVARVFLATESALASLVIAEEFRPHRRGAGLSVLGVVSGAGFGAVGLLMLLVPLTTLGWRLFYVFALIPLGIVVYLRRNLRETCAFLTARDEHRLQESFWPRIDAVHRRTLIRAVIVVSAFGLVQTSGFFYASDLAQNAYGWSSRFTWIVVTAGVFGIAGFILGGHVSDRVGRRPMIALANVCAAAGTILIFTGQRSLFIPGFFLDAAAGGLFCDSNPCVRGRTLSDRGSRHTELGRDRLSGRGGLAGVGVARCDRRRRRPLARDAHTGWCAALVHSAVAGYAGNTRT